MSALVAVHFGDSSLILERAAMVERRDAVDMLCEGPPWLLDIEGA